MVTFKIAAKGGVSVYGLGRFPVTLYAGQWDKLLANVSTLQLFIDQHRAELANKTPAGAHAAVDASESA